jgi:hypothetical protein
MTHETNVDWKEYAQSRQTGAFLVGIGSGGLLFITLFFVILSLTSRGASNKHDTFCESISVSINEYKQVVRSLDLCNERLYLQTAYNAVDCEQRLDDCYWYRGEACFCPGYEDRPNSHGLSYTELEERLDDICRYRFEEKGDSYGTMWSIYCVGIGGRREEDEKKYFTQHIPEEEEDK